MKREVYEKQKTFAGEKKASMLRRCIDHDYTDRQMYLVTMVIEGRRPLFGEIVGRSDADCLSEGTVVGSGDAAVENSDEPRIVLSELGQRVSDEWWGIPNYYPQIEIIALQMMPDHLHGILFVKEKMEKDLSRIIRGFKTGCNRAYRELFPPVPSVATQSQECLLSPSIFFYLLLSSFIYKASRACESKKTFLGFIFLCINIWIFAENFVNL